MIKLFLIPALIIIGCGSTKSNQSPTNTDSVNINNNSQKDKDSLNNNAANTFQLPACIQNKIDSFKVKEIHERPQKVVEYLYKEKKVYYIVMPCCDFFNEVYDDKCNYLGAPDGGFTGKGDGKIPDFFTEAKEEKLIWKAANN